VRESVAAKAHRYLAEGRLEVREVTPDRIVATCRGDGATYRLGHDARGWWCDCPHRGPRCAHAVALRLVVTRTPGVGRC
jgi:uncharacterized Zn finger protein